MSITFIAYIIRFSPMRAPGEVGKYFLSILIPSIFLNTHVHWYTYPACMRKG